MPAKMAGFRAALTAAEKVGMEIPPGPIQFTPWALKEQANAQLHTFLLHQTQGRALQIAEDPAMEGRGFETWRKMKEEFEPKGGAYEMKVLQSLMSPARSKNLSTLYDDIRQWETRIFKWEQRTGQQFPQMMKLPGIHLMLRDDFREEFDRRFTFESHDYDTLMTALKQYTQQKNMQKFSMSFEKASIKDPAAMDVDSVDVYKAEWSDHLNRAYAEGVEHCEEDIGEPTCSTGDVALDALMRNSYRQGRAKGKGKGKGGGWQGNWGQKPGKGSGKGDKTGKGKGGSGTQSMTAKQHDPDILCYRCGERGHIAKKCTNERGSSLYKSDSGSRDRDRGRERNSKNRRKDSSRSRSRSRSRSYDHRSCIDAAVEATTISIEAISIAIPIRARAI